MNEDLIKKMALRIAELEKRVKVLEERTHCMMRSDSGKSEEEYVLMYGGHVDKTVAAKILGVTRATVYAMLRDGRLQAAFGGSRVDVRSIARYIKSSEGHPRRRGKAKEVGECV